MSIDKMNNVLNTTNSDEEKWISEVKKQLNNLQSNIEGQADKLTEKQKNAIIYLYDCIKWSWFDQINKQPKNHAFDEWYRYSYNLKNGELEEWAQKWRKQPFSGKICFWKETKDHTLTFVTWVDDMNPSKAFIHVRPLWDKKEFDITNEKSFSEYKEKVEKLWSK